MTHTDSRKPLWTNLVALMNQRYGGENLNRLARECCFSPATATRLKQQQTSVGLDTIDKLADYFGVKPHDLINPDFDPNRITLQAGLSPLALDLGQMLDRISDPVQQDRAYAIAVGVLQLGNTSAPRVADSAPKVAPSGEPSRSTAKLPTR